MRIKRLLLALSLSLLVGKSFAISFKVDGISYVANADTAIIKGYSDVPENGELTLASTVSYGGKEYSVTTVQKSAFLLCSELKKLVIPSTIKYIQSCAFEKCKMLKYVNFLAGDEVLHVKNDAFIDCALDSVLLSRHLDRTIFEGDKHLKKISFGDNYNILEDNFLANCSALKDVELNKISTLGNEAFSNCVSLEQISLDNVRNIGQKAFYQCVNLKKFNASNVVSINDYAFQSSGLKDVNLGTQIQYLGKGVFESCTNLTNFNLDCELFSIPEECFMGCSSLKIMELPTSIKEIGKNAFAYSGLKECNLNAVKRVEDNGFNHCLNLKNVQWGNVEYLGVGAFNNTGLKEIILPSSVTEISMWAFFDCKQLEKVDMSKTQLTFIGCFKGCSMLKTVLLPSNLKMIGGSCFEDCSALEELSLPNSLETLINNSFKSMISLKTIDLRETKVHLIPSSCFYGCQSLESVYLNAHTDTIGSFAFANCTALSLLENTNNIKEISTNAFDNTNLFEHYQDGPIMMGSILYAYNGKIADQKYYVPEGVTCISDKALSNQDFSEIVFNKELRSIGTGALDNCTNLLKLRIPNNVEYIGSNNGCINLVLLTVDEGTEKLDLQPFENSPIKKFYMGRTLSSKVDWMDKLEYLTIGCKVKQVVNDFTNSKNLVDLEIEDADETLELGLNPIVKQIKTLYLGRNISVGTYEEADDFYNRKPIIKKGNGFSNLEDLTIGDKVTEICDYFCYNNNVLTSLTFPNNIKRIGNYAFYRNAKIEKIIFDDNLESIGDFAFGFVEDGFQLGDYNNYLKGLGIQKPVYEELDIPSSVKSIGKYALSGKNSHKLVLNEGVENLGYMAFMGCSADSVYLPSTAVFDGECFNYADYKYFDAHAHSGKGLHFGYGGVDTFVFPKELENVTPFGWFSIRKLSIPETVKSIEGDVLTSYYGSYTSLGTDGTTATGTVTIEGKDNSDKIYLCKGFDASSESDHHKVQLEKLSINRSLEYDFDNNQYFGCVNIGIDSLIIGNVKEFDIKSQDDKRFVPTTAICLSHYLTSCDMWKPTNGKIYVLPGSQLPANDITYMYTVNKLNYDLPESGDVIFDGFNNMPFEITPVFYQDEKEVALSETGTYDLSMKISGTSYDGIYPTDLKVTVASSTGIDSITMDDNTKKCPIYNMNGQRVDSSYKGVIIQNGKKRIAK